MLKEEAFEEETFENETFEDETFEDEGIDAKMFSCDYSYTKDDITDMTGDFIKDAAEELRSYIDVPKSMILSIILPIMSAAIGTKATTFNGAMEKMRVNLWGIVIGSSGASAKSTTLGMLKDIVLGALEKKLKHEYKIAKITYNQLSFEERENAENPRLQQIYSGQGSTFAGMIKKLSFNEHGLLSVYDEGSEFLNKMLNDKQNKASFTSLYAQQSYGKDLVGKEGSGEQIWIDNPFISLILISNPHWFNSDVKNNDFVSGFLNRFSIYRINKDIEMKPFASRKKHDFEKFQNVSIMIWDYLNKLENKLEMELSEESVLRYQSWYELASSKTFKEIWRNNEGGAYDPFELIWESEEFTAFLVRQKTAAIKYAMIIQIFDTFYNGDKTLPKEIDLKYMNIGIIVAEEAMCQIKNFLLVRRSAKDEKKYREDNYRDIAHKIKNYLKKYGYDESKPLATSKLIRGIKALNKTNFNKVLECATQDEGIKSETRKFGYDSTVTYYYLPSNVDKWEDDDNYEDSNIEINEL
ncbi:DUF3987 domain-containing protein [Sulfurovum sp. NBC37-1]|uniref:DUF3987 domain-containing protein n=1 Tax=Sulfurovum sp. (strain NBC37-1) TaxID=387093 RepID=UPI0001587985|nr:DUF3987 domain-containing protein [Sulfurovum sp. NBC37-1]BAF73244.1 hypothetical protein SUN_2305 [Sulfurovum sp. NBC37-1]